MPPLLLGAASFAAAGADPIHCGEETFDPDHIPAAISPASGEATDVLALEWEPGFCEIHGNAPPECKTAGGASAHFSLHGLWPEPRGRYYCGVDVARVRTDCAPDFGALPAPVLSPETSARLAAIMPGTQSRLDRHEWLKHGSCYGGDAEAYFRRAIDLAEQVNASPALHPFVESAGRTVSAEEVRAAFDAAFGPGAGERVKVLCAAHDGASDIFELDIFLAGDVAGSAPIADLLHAARPVAPDCAGGVVRR